MVTERLFDTDAYLPDFTATVISCEKCKEMLSNKKLTIKTPAGKSQITDQSSFSAQATETWKITLDQTAFFPQGGGQSADGGTLGEANVLDAYESDGIIFHITDRPLPVGTQITGKVDFELRFRKMQEHTGEHILSGIADSLYGCTNVGFHLGKAEVTLDYDIPLTEQQLLCLEEKANRAVFRNLPVKSFYPDGTTLSALSYRSKKALSGAVRIVEIEGIDRCACCAPHVRRTGEVGIIRIVQNEKYKGGVRLWIRCGWDALEDGRADRTQLFELSRLLSAKLPDCASATNRLFAECDALKKTISELRLSLLEEKLKTAVPENGSLFDFSPANDIGTMRRFVNECLPKCSFLCGSFSGSDELGYTFVLASQNDLSEITATLRKTLGARCGGSATMITGSVIATKKALRSFFSSANQL